MSISRGNTQFRQRASALCFAACGVNGSSEVLWKVKADHSCLTFLQKTEMKMNAELFSRGRYFR